MKVSDRVQRIFWQLATTSGDTTIIITGGALIFSVIITMLIVTASGLLASCQDAWLSWGQLYFCYDPVQTARLLFISPLENKNNLAYTLRETTILVFTGLAVAISFRSGLFNIGVQGQMIFGSIAAAVGLLLVAPLAPTGLIGTMLLLPIGILIGAVVGGVWGLIPGVMKAYWNVNEVITTIMLNFVAANFAFALVVLYYQNPTSDIVETAPLPPTASLDPLFLAPRSNFSTIALLAAVGCVIVVYMFQKYSILGYSFRISGLQSKAAEYSGIDGKRTVIYSMGLSGAMGGVGGAIWAMMIYGGWAPGMPPYGFDGITVSILAGNNPIGVLPAALLFGILQSGSVSVDFASSVPKQLVDILRGMIVLFVAMPGFFKMLGRYINREGRYNRNPPQQRNPNEK